MKTIAVTIDPAMLARLDRLAGSAAKSNRSRVVREAVHAYLAQHERAAGDAREAAVIRKHAARLRRQARAAVREQAKP